MSYVCIDTQQIRRVSFSKDRCLYRGPETDTDEYVLLFGLSRDEQRSDSHSRKEEEEREKKKKKKKEEKKKKPPLRGMVEHPPVAVAEEEEKPRVGEEASRGKKSKGEIERQRDR